MTTYANGKAPTSALTALPVRFTHGSGDRYTTREAAASLLRMEVPFRRDLGIQLQITDGYRTWALQSSIFLARYVAGSGGTNDYRRWNGVVYNRRRGTAAASVPGRSNHGTFDPAACDFASGINSFHSKAHAWMVKNAGHYGWVHPHWARKGGPTPEAWHWEYHAKLDRSRNDHVAPAAGAEQAAHLGYAADLTGIKQAQHALGVIADGIWGQKTQEAYMALIDEIKALRAVVDRPRVVFFTNEGSVYVAHVETRTYQHVPNEQTLAELQVNLNRQGIPWTTHRQFTVAGESDNVGNTAVYGTEIGARA